MIQIKEKKSDKKKALNQPDEPINFAQLMVREGNDAMVDELQQSLMAAVSGGPGGEKQEQCFTLIKNLYLVLSLKIILKNRFIKPTVCRKK